MPSGTPPTVVNKLYFEILAILKTEEVRRGLPMMDPKSSGLGLKSLPLILMVRQTFLWVVSEQFATE